MICGCDWTTKTVCKDCSGRIEWLMQKINDPRWFDGEFGWKYKAVLNSSSDKTPDNEKGRPHHRRC